MGRIVAETPIAVLDFETTGLNAGPDRVVEVAVVRLDPGAEPRMMVNTLVNPQRKMAATEIHGITDADVADAPCFRDVADAFLAAVDGAIIAAYNVYFDVRFLEYELGAVGVRQTPPHVCLMYLRPLLGLGKKCSLDDACADHGIHRGASHQAAVDALAGASLWSVYTKAMGARGIQSFDQLLDLAQYKFLDSLGSAPLSSRHGASSSGSAALKPREISAESTAPAESRARPARKGKRSPYHYWEALTVALTDLEASDEEISSLAALRADLGLTVPQVRALHAKAFAELLSQTIQDKVVDDQEDDRIRKMHSCLARIGWAPGG